MSRWRRVAASVVALGLLGGLLIPPGSFPTPRSTAILDTRGHLLGATVARDGQWRFPEGDSIPFRFEQAMLEAEDRRFYLHPGIDPWAVLRALRSNLGPHRRIQGASTLTMQVARLLRRSQGLAPARNLPTKLFEAFLALRLEFWNRKTTILRLWSANAPFGGNVVGLEAAAWRWYGTAPEDLTWGQCATLAAIPNAPSWLLGSESGRQELVRRRDAILDHLQEDGHLDSLDASLAKAEPLPASPHPLPRLAPHALARLARVAPGHRWTTTLDEDLQATVGRMARAQLDDLSSKGIPGLSVLVLEVPAGDSLPLIRAWIGDAGPQSVDLATAPRSTASTLKPFLYGLLLDQGRILPHQWLVDVPSRWGVYRPKNASGVFEGAVPAHQALARSLNVPWVRSLHEVGIEPFLGLLRRAGLGHLHRSAEGYGLSLVLGGGEASLLELATAYAGLARQGRVSTVELARSGTRTIHLGGPPLEGQPPPRSPREGNLLEDLAMTAPPRERRILSPGASWLVLDALRIPGRSEEETAWRAFAGGRPLAWKTGTSFGFRDAWTIAVRPRWVVAVWVGDPSGAGHPHLGGSFAAAPLAFRLQPMLPRRGAPIWFPPPPDLVPIAACPVTGFRHTPACPPAVAVMAPASTIGAPLDPWHHREPVDPVSGRRVSSSCRSGESPRMESVLNLPAGVEALMRAHGKFALPSVVHDDSDCTGSTGSPLQILIPEPGARIILPRDIDGEVQKLAIQVAHRRREARIQCWLDHRDLGASVRFRDFLVQPDPGDHVVLCQDEEGARDRVAFHVEWTQLARKTGTRVGED